jgi:hypothetical protein
MPWKGVTSSRGLLDGMMGRNMTQILKMTINGAPAKL